MRAKKLSKCFIFAGLLLIAAALCLVGYNLYEDAQAATAASDVLQEIRVGKETPPQEDAAQPEPIIPDYILDPNMAMPTEEINGETYIGVVDIPALKLSLPVISEWSYPRLKIAPCRYQGSAYLDNLIIAAHNYKSHFGNLAELKIGDKVYFLDIDENVFAYEVVEIETLDGFAVESMAEGDWDLTLFTCTVEGKNRVTVRCKRTE